MKYLLILCSIILFSCVSLKKEMDRTIGDFDRELIDKYGNPDRKEPNGRGGEIWFYQRLKQGMLTNGQVLQAYEYRIFYIGSDNVVYAWRVEQQPVPVQQVNVNMYIR